MNIFATFELLTEVMKIKLSLLTGHRNGVRRHPHIVLCATCNGFCVKPLKKEHTCTYK